MKICGAVILYHPSIYEINNAITLSSVFDEFYIFDNTDERISPAQIDGMVERNIKYINFNNNMGLSSAYNFLCQTAIKEDQSFLCLLDQDSKFDIMDILKMIEIIKSTDCSDIAVISPKVLHYYEKPLSFNEECNLQEVKWSISSGSFINLEVAKYIGFFDSNYFIDRVDQDYCKTARSLGYKIIQVKNIFLYQSLGSQDEKRIRRYSNHSALRHYYISRNRLYYYFKHYSFLYALTTALLMLMKHFIQILLFENEKSHKIKFIFVGIHDFFKKNYGKKNTGIR